MSHPLMDGCRPLMDDTYPLMDRSCPLMDRCHPLMDRCHPLMDGHARVPKRLQGLAAPKNAQVWQNWMFCALPKFQPSISYIQGDISSFSFSVQTIRSLQQTYLNLVQQSMGSNPGHYKIGYISSRYLGYQKTNFRGPAPISRGHWLLGNCFSRVPVSLCPCIPVSLYTCVPVSLCPCVPVSLYTCVSVYL